MLLAYYKHVIIKVVIYMKGSQNMVQHEGATETLVNKLIKEIQANKIGDATNKLPSEPELMAQYNVTRYTLRQALAKLSNMGYLYQAHGIGTFVRPRLDNSIISIQNSAGLTTKVSRQGKRLTTEHASIKTTTVQEAEFLPSASRLDPQESLWAVQRLRYLDDKPFIFERSYYLKDIVGDMPESALYGSLFDFIEKNDALKPGFQDEAIAAESMNSAMSTFFKLPIGSPVLCVYDDSYLNNGKLFAFSKISYDSHLMKLFMFKKI